MKWVVFVKFSGDLVGIVRGITHSKEEMHKRFGCDIDRRGAGFRKVSRGLHYKFGAIHVMPYSVAKRRKDLTWEEVQ